MNTPFNRDRNKVLVIHDNRVGHLNPSIAVSEMIEKRFFLQAELFQIPFLSKHLVSLFKKLSNFPRLYTAAARLIFKFPTPNLEHTDVIVCSGMPNLIYAAYLSQRFNIPLIYAGGTRKFNWRLIDWTITTIPENHAGRQIIIPTGAVPSKITSLVNIPSNHEACLLIGGPTHEYPFTELDFIQMIENFVQFSELHKFKATVVCSRRTPTLTSETISYLQSKNIELVCPQSSTSICDVFKRSEFIFVTEDSATMLSESIQTGRVVISVCREDSKTDAIIQGYLDHQFIQRKTISQLKDVELTSIKIDPKLIETIITQQLVDDLKAQSKNLSFYQSHMSKLKML